MRYVSGRIVKKKEKEKLYILYISRKRWNLKMYMNELKICKY